MKFFFLWDTSTHKERFIAVRSVGFRLLIWKALMHWKSFCDFLICFPKVLLNIMKFTACEWHISMEQVSQGDSGLGRRDTYGFHMPFQAPDISFKIYILFVNHKKSLFLNINRQMILNSQNLQKKARFGVIKKMKLMELTKKVSFSLHENFLTNKTT